MADSSYRPSSASHTHSVPSTSITATQAQDSIPVLRLRATGPAQRRQLRIQWAEDVVDNEGLGRKRSKVCCIYHAPHAVGESSSESSSDSDSSDSDSDSDSGQGNDDGKARMGGKGAARKGSPSHGLGKDEDRCEHDHRRGKGPKKKAKAAGKQRKPNAYEAVPHVRSKMTGEKS